MNTSKESFPKKIHNISVHQFAGANQLTEQIWGKNAKIFHHWPMLHIDE